MNSINITFEVNEFRKLVKKKNIEERKTFKENRWWS